MGIMLFVLVPEFFFVGIMRSDLAPVFFLATFYIYFAGGLGLQSALEYVVDTKIIHLHILRGTQVADTQRDAEIAYGKKS